jgi:hypothetical protein
MINYLGLDDPTSRRMMEGITWLSKKEHADDLQNFLDKMG